MSKRYSYEKCLGCCLILRLSNAGSLGGPGSRDECEAGGIQMKSAHNPSFDLLDQIPSFCGGTIHDPVSAPEGLASSPLIRPFSTLFRAQFGTCQSFRWPM
jgi:hypothetical protein